MYPNTSGSLLTGSLGGLLKKINFSSFLEGTSKTLNVINQAIPVYYQVKPIITNLTTIKKIGKIVSHPEEKEEEIEIEEKKEVPPKNGNPIFYI